MPENQLLLPQTRLVRWLENFETRHGGAEYEVIDGQLVGSAPDGSVCRIALPFGRSYGGPATAAGLLDQAAPPEAWGVLLVRKGGFAVAMLAGAELTGSKTGQRHVQGRTKAGGPSQPRLARRRENQARIAYEAAADHAVRLLGARPAPEVVITGGDHAAVDAVLDDPRLRGVARVVVRRWLPVADPRRSVLEQAIAEAQALDVVVTNAT